VTYDYLLPIVQCVPLPLHSQCIALHMGYVKSSPPRYQPHISTEVSPPVVRVSYLSPHPDTITASFTPVS